MPAFVRLLAARLLPALLTAMGVVLVTGGLLSYADPNTAGLAVRASFEIPSDGPAASPTGRPGASVDPAGSPSGDPGDDPTGSPPASIVPDPTAVPTRSPGRAVATRVVIPALKIDLPIVKGNEGYPLCNVAMYLHTAAAARNDAFGQPGEDRATYLYAHARDRMFGPIYELAIERKNAKKMLGMVVQVYTSDNRLHLYEIAETRLHQVGAKALEDALNATTETLWLQTSEGPRGTPGKTQVIAKPISVTDADPGDAHPRPRPVNCA